MMKKFIAILVLLVLSFSLFELSPFVRATIVFSDDFSTGTLAKWSEIYIGAGSSQIVSNGIARFIVPTPPSGSDTYSYVEKDGFTSTINSTIVATQDVYITKVPNGRPLGNGAIFFFYICGSPNLNGDDGNIGVGIDGSDVWSLWIGGSTDYSYVFQTAGSAPVSNTWYHIVLTIDNPAGTVTLTVNDTVVINAGQQQFTDKTHSFNLVSGMGEDWWCEGSGQQEVDIANVQLDISDAPTPTPSQTLTPQTSQSTPGQNVAPTTSSKTVKPSPSPSPEPSPTPSLTSIIIQATVQEGSNVNLTISGNVTNSQISSATITKNKTGTQTTVSFSLIGQSGTPCFGNITIPKIAVQPGMLPAVYIDKQLAPSQGYTQDANNYYVWCTMNFSTHAVSIVFAPNSSKSEFPFWLVLPLTIAVVVCVVVMFKFRKRYA